MALVTRGFGPGASVPLVVTGGYGSGSAVLPPAGLGGFLSQARMDRLGRAAVRMQGTRVERVTYHARATPGAVPVDHAGLVVRFRDYSLRALGTGEILLTDQECLIQTALVSWAPTHDDTITRADGTLWQVLSVRGGTGRPFWLLQTRQVG